jgi:hypothetical protein
MTERGESGIEIGARKGEREKGTGYLNLAGRPRGRSVDSALIQQWDRAGIYQVRQARSVVVKTGPIPKALFDGREALPLHL